MKNKKLIVLNSIILSVAAAILCGCNGSDSVKKMSGGEIITHIDEKDTVQPAELITMQSQPEEESVTESSAAQETSESTYQLSETNDTMYAVSVVNVRNMPNVEGDIITVLNRGDCVQRIGTLDNGWSKVSINGIDCYVNTVYLTNEPPTETQTQTQIETENNTTIQETTTAQVISTPKDAKQIAQSYIGKTMDSLKAVIGAELSQVHAASCYYEGEMDGIFYYQDFTVYTHTVNGVDIVDFVE